MGIAIETLPGMMDRFAYKGLLKRIGGIYTITSIGLAVYDTKTYIKNGHLQEPAEGDLSKKSCYHQILAVLLEKGLAIEHTGRYSVIEDVNHFIEFIESAA